MPFSLVAATKSGPRLLHSAFIPIQTLCALPRHCLIPPISPGFTALATMLPATSPLPALLVVSHPRSHPATLPSALPYLPVDVLIRIFSCVGWLAIPPLRLVCHHWSDSVKAGQATQAVIRARDATRGRVAIPAERLLGPARVVAAVKMYPALRRLTLSPGRPKSGLDSGASAYIGSPYAGPSATVVASLLRSWARDGVGAHLEMLDLSDVGTEPGKGNARHTASVLSPGLFAVLVSPGSDLRDLRVARCRWWNDTFVNGALGGAEEEILLEQFVPRLDALRMGGTSGDRCVNQDLLGRRGSGHRRPRVHEGTRLADAAFNLAGAAAVCTRRLCGRQRGGRRECGGRNCRSGFAWRGDRGEWTRCGRGGRPGM